MCGIPYQEFLLLDVTEFAPMLKKGIELITQERQHSYEVARFNAWLSILPHVKKESQPKSPDKLIRFDWEKQKSREAAEDLKGVDLRELVKETFKLPK